MTPPSITVRTNRESFSRSTSGGSRSRVIKAFSNCGSPSLKVVRDPLMDKLKNSLFYRTQNGARVGDVFMTLIHTAELCGANPFDYLTQLQRQADEVARAPARWLPWNYRDSLLHSGIAA
jgi:hypothetical protein